MTASNLLFYRKERNDMYDNKKIVELAESIRQKEKMIREESQALERLKAESLEFILETLGFKDKVVETLKEKTPKKGVLKVTTADGHPDIRFYRIKKDGEISKTSIYVNGLYGTLFWYLGTENIKELMELKKAFRVVGDKELAHKPKQIERD